MALLAFLFFLTALLYSMAGFGGGSTYNALLVLHGVDYQVLPAISLCCNIVVVSVGAVQFLRSRAARLRDILPLCLLSAPAAWIGGRIPVPEQLFVGLLGLSLLFAAAFMFMDLADPPRRVREGRKYALPMAVGGGVGLVSGLVGIGGGIFLAPFLHLVRWGNAREIAAAASIFILVNSLAGLAGQLAKLDDMAKLGAFGDYLILPAVVAVGGAVGSFVGARKLPVGLIKKLTGALILTVALRLLWRWANM